MLEDENTKNLINQIRKPRAFKFIIGFLFSSWIYLFLLTLLVIYTLGTTFESPIMQGFQTGLYETFALENVATPYNYGYFMGQMIIPIFFSLIPIIGIYMKKILLLRIALIIAVLYFLILGQFFIFLFMLVSMILSFKSDIEEYFIAIKQIHN
ncbi:hypothetical protein [Leptospira koniambonensis]|uniref:hypothetical protein n=1 Tax=Leptospira koniambonensis TaxID=2484950 RepID=UPI003EB96B77